MGGPAECAGPGALCQYRETVVVVVCGSLFFLSSGGYAHSCPSWIAAVVDGWRDGVDAIHRDPVATEWMEWVVMDRRMVWLLSQCQRRRRRIIVWWSFLFERLTSSE